MVTFTTKLNGRKGPCIQPTLAEAAVMYERGFRFSIYEPEQGEVQLSRPCNLMIASHKDELTFEQP